MSEQENYGEPWHQIGNDHVIYTPNDIRVAGGVDGRFAKRIIACVNLLRGVSTAPALYKCPVCNYYTATTRTRPRPKPSINGSIDGRNSIRHF